MKSAEVAKEEIANEIAVPLVKWYHLHHRTFPWRYAPAGRRDPYRVWISEIMAQQTRVETVVGFYERWMQRFPTVASLAQADQHDVLTLWQGLGYYARARNLHKAARLVVDRHAGQIPQNRDQLLALPGIGKYTVGAILSLAFNQPQPILDGNVKRVLTRLEDIADPIDEAPTERRLWTFATEIVIAASPDSYGACNEALMELGATLCTPTQPRCDQCPLQAYCQAAASGTQTERPVKKRRAPIPHYDVAAGLIWQGEPLVSKLLIAQRPQTGMLGGLWEFPGGKLEAGDADLRACLRREIKEELAIDIEVLEPLAVVKHAYTHFRITLHAFHARYVTGTPQALGCDDFRWVEPGALANFPFPVTDQKLIKALHKLLHQPEATVTG